MRIMGGSKDKKSRCGCPEHGRLSAGAHSGLRDDHLIAAKGKYVSKKIMDILNVPRGKSYICRGCIEYARQQMKVINGSHFVVYCCAACIHVRNSNWTYFRMDKC